MKWEHSAIDIMSFRFIQPPCMESEGLKDSDVTIAIAYLHMFIAKLKQLVKYMITSTPYAGGMGEHPVCGWDGGALDRPFP